MSVNLQAGEIEYSCVIKSELVTTDNGNLRPNKNHQNIGKVFIIDKLNGHISGYLLGNATAGKVEIITSGGKGQSFVILSTSSPTGKVTTDLLVIEAWNKSPNKPFTAVSGSNVYSGTCN